MLRLQKGTRYEINPRHDGQDNVEPFPNLDSYKDIDVESSVKDILTANGWKQDALAMRFALSQSTISNWLNGKQRPSRLSEFETLVRLHKEAQTKLWDQASQAALSFDYLCSISEDGYPSNLPEIAKSILCEALAKDHLNW